MDLVADRTAIQVELGRSASVSGAPRRGLTQPTSRPPEACVARGILTLFQNAVVLRGVRWRLGVRAVRTPGEALVLRSQSGCCCRCCCRCYTACPALAAAVAQHVHGARSTSGLFESRPHRLRRTWRGNQSRECRGFTVVGAGPGREGAWLQRSETRCKKYQVQLVECLKGRKKAQMGR